MFLNGAVFHIVQGEIDKNPVIPVLPVLTIGTNQDTQDVCFPLSCS
jgi:hypothetical protein